MDATHSSQEKRTAVEHLNFGAKTAKRAAWEAWEFTVIGPRLLEVVNASYGAEKQDHTYQVHIGECDGHPVPVECGCPADEYNDEYACKHRVAAATVGGLPVLKAAASYGDATTPSSVRSASSQDAVIRTDGGSVMEITQEGDQACPNGDEQCDGPDGADLPCWPCYRTGEGV